MLKEFFEENGIPSDGINVTPFRALEFHDGKIVKKMLIEHSESGFQFWVYIHTLKSDSKWEDGFSNDLIIWLEGSHCKAEFDISDDTVMLDAWYYIDKITKATKTKKKEVIDKNIVDFDFLEELRAL